MSIYQSGHKFIKHTKLPEVIVLGEMIQDELLRATRKHGIDRTPLNPEMPPASKLIILVEEIGEVARAMTYDEGSIPQLKAELVQVAAMAMAWWFSLEGSV